MLLTIVLFLLFMTNNLQSDASGFDAYSSCYRTSRKRQDLPCDFNSQTWCTIPGNSYPWHAVRRFVHENQGLMRRMYGDERHLAVLRAELESNDIEYLSSPSTKEEFRRRYSKDIDGVKEFVKMFINNEGRNFEKTTKPDKAQKSIEEKSNNVLYHNHFQNSKDEIKNWSYGNKTNQKTTAAATVITTVKTTTVETTVGSSTNVEVSFNVTTTEATNATFTVQTLGNEATTQATTAFPLNHSKSSNDTFVGEFEDTSETEETPTTTSWENLSTTDAEFEESGTEKEEFVDAVEEVEEDHESVKEPVPQQSSHMIRLKGINACPVKEEVVAPFWANNTRGEVLALLNLYPFEQYVHWEKCTYEHKQMFCREGCRCEQQYRLHRLLAYDPNNECRGIFSDWFRFPSCCVCKCYDLPMEFRLTSRSPRFQSFEVFGKESVNQVEQRQPTVTFP